VAVRLSRRSPAAIRHIVLLAAFGVLVVLPLAASLAPAISIEVPAAPPPAAPAAPIEAGSPVASDTAIEPGVAAPAGTPPTASSGSAMLRTAWAAGLALCLLPVVAGLWLTGSLRRSALPWKDGQAIATGVARDLGVGRRVEILLHESLAGPMTCGLLRP